MNAAGITGSPVPHFVAHGIGLGWGVTAKAAKGTAVDDLNHLADLIRIRNFINASVGRIIQGPAETGRIAEFVASQIFDIELADTFVNKSVDGWFRSPAQLKETSVNVKYRSTLSRRLNLIDSSDLSNHPEFYLAFRGPFIAKGPAADKVLPFLIESVYLFAAEQLISAMTAEGYRSFGPSVRKKFWDAAMIYPEQVNQTLILTDQQRAALALFSPT